MDTTNRLTHKKNTSGEQDIATLLENQKKEFEARRKITREALVQEYIQCMFTDKGSKIQIDKKYLNEKVWIRITEAELFRQLFPAHLWRIADDIDRYYIFIKRSNPRLFSLEDMKIKREYLLKKYDDDLMRILYKSRVDPNVLDTMTYYTLKDLLSNNGIKVIEEDDIQSESTVEVNVNKKNNK